MSDLDKLADIVRLAWLESEFGPSYMDGFCAWEKLDRRHQVKWRAIAERVSEQAGVRDVSIPVQISGVA